MRQGVERTLFVASGGVAGFLASLPAVHALGRTYPRARHEVLTFAAGAELLAADPFVDYVHVSPPADLTAACDRLLAVGRYDLVVAGPRPESEPETAVALEVVVAAEADARLYNNGIVDAHALGDGRVYLTAAERAAARRVRLGEVPLVALLVGGACAEWPDERIAAAGRALWRRGADIVVVPAAREARARTIAAAVEPSARLWPRRPLRELAARLTQVDLALGADAALCRLAAAVGAPTLDLWAAPLLDAADVQREAEHVLGARLQSGKAARRSAAYGRDAGVPVHEAASSKLANGGSTAAAGAGFSARAGSEPSASVLEDPPGPLRRLGFAMLRRRPRDDAWHRARRLLVVRADNIGDVVMTGPALRAIKRTLPDCGLTLLASPSGAMAAPLLPWLDGTIAWRVLWQELHGRPADPASERRLVATLQARRFDGAIVLTSFSQSPHAPACAAWLAGIPLRAGASDAHGFMLTHALPKGDLGRHQAERNLDLVRALGFDTDDDSLEIRVPDGARCGAAALLASRGVPAGRPYLLVSPWASIEARTYDGSRLARAAKIISAAAGMPIVVTGHKRDGAKAALLAERMGPAAINLCGDTSVTELAALVAQARLVLTNNTSVMHLADALRTPAVVIYSGTDLESQWAPRRTPHRLLRKPTACSPCYAFTCPLDRACMDIEPADVADAALALLSAAGRDA
jgi:ADP-heptose:LPS heptosyltransferase